MAGFFTKMLILFLFFFWCVQVIFKLSSLGYIFLQFSKNRMKFNEGQKLKFWLFNAIVTFDHLYQHPSCGSMCYVDVIMLVFCIKC